MRPLSGLLLAGPPGTGKTSVARTLAAQAWVSFYPLSTADLTGPWVGQAEQCLARLFERARAGGERLVTPGRARPRPHRRTPHPRDRRCGSSGRGSRGPALWRISSLLIGNAARRVPSSDTAVTAHRSVARRRSGYPPLPAWR
ncbi:AAA family ATPase [Kitasatospora sp. SUK 42]|nr:AAA family ATPase [Kitasatospora sp. SUK 42]